MPRKIRELKAQILHEGFIYLPKRGKGSHERWQHPLLRKTLTIPGKDLLCTHKSGLRKVPPKKDGFKDRKSTRLNSSHRNTSRMPSSA